jgi:hypothetical protein
LLKKDKQEQKHCSNGTYTSNHINSSSFNSNGYSTTAAMSNLSLIEEESVCLKWN